MNELMALLEALLLAKHSRREIVKGYRQWGIDPDDWSYVREARKIIASQPFEPPEPTMDVIDKVAHFNPLEPPDSHTFGEWKNLYTTRAAKTSLVHDLTNGMTPRLGLLAPELRGALTKQGIRQIWRQPVQSWGSILMGLLSKAWTHE